MTVYDCSVECGARQEEEELAAIASGHSKLKDPFDSKHVVGPKRLLALAVDVAPYPVVWPDARTMALGVYAKAIARFYTFYGFVKARALALGIPIRFGGDWDGDLDFTDQSFDDLDHYELVG